MSKPLVALMEIAAAVGATALVIVLAITAILNYQKRTTAALSQGDAVYDEIENAEFTRYQDETVSGSEVLNLIKRYDGTTTGIIVTVSTNGTTTSTCYCKGLSYSNGVATYSDSITLGSIADAKDITKPTLYINPTKKFDGAVLKDAAGNIIGLHFTLNN